MEKKKKIKISIISAVVAVVLIASGLLTYLLLSKKDDNKKLKTLLANVSSQIFATYNDLAESYNSETSAQAVCYSSPSNINISVVASPISETGNDDIWNLTQGTDTFQDYLDNINNVVAHYAIAEYLVSESGKSIDLSKAYHFKSSTVEYYATADYVDNKYFSFTIQNDDEKIRVRVNIQADKSLGESIEFFKEAKINGNKYYYQYSILNFTTSKYAEVSLTAKKILSGVFDKYWVNSNVEEHDEHEINHKDKNSFIGKKYQRNDKTADETNQTTQSIFDKLNGYKDKLFGNFNGANNDKKDVEEFPNAQGMQDYAFNKYVAKIMTDANGKQSLIITRKANDVDDASDVLVNPVFSGDVWTWEYKEGYEVVSQIYCGKLLPNEARSVNTKDFEDTNNKTLELICKNGDEYYRVTMSSLSGSSSVDSEGGSSSGLVNQEQILFEVRFGSTDKDSDDHTSENINHTPKSSATISFDAKDFTILSWGYNKLSDSASWNTMLETFDVSVIELSVSLDTVLDVNSRNCTITEEGVYEFIVYYKDATQFYKTTLKLSLNNNSI